MRGRGAPSQFRTQPHSVNYSHSPGTTMVQPRPWSVRKVPAGSSPSPLVKEIKGYCHSKLRDTLSYQVVCLPEAGWESYLYDGEPLNLDSTLLGKTTSSIALYCCRKSRWCSPRLRWIFFVVVWRDSSCSWLYALATSSNAKVQPR